MIQPQYQPTYISTQTTTVIEGSAKNITVHTVNIPIALTGALTFEDITGTPVVYFVFPIGSVGTFLLDVSLSNGLKVVTAAGDKVLITTQQP